MVDSIGNNKNDVPYFSQEEGIVKEKYGDNGCGITSLKMSIDYILKKEHRFEDIFQVEVGSFKDGLWLHDGLIRIAKHFGASAYRIDLSGGFFGFCKLFLRLVFSGATTKELFGFYKKSFKLKTKRFLALRGIVDEGSAVLLSMSKEYCSNLEDSHLIVLIGYTKDSFIIHDPWNFGPNHEILFEDFEKYWTKRAIIISSL